MSITLVESLDRSASTATVRTITLANTVIEGDQIFYIQFWQDPDNNITASYPGAEVVIAKTHLTAPATDSAFQVWRITAPATPTQVYGPTLSASTLMFQQVYNLRSTEVISLTQTGTNRETTSGSTITVSSAALTVSVGEFCIVQVIPDIGWGTSWTFTDGYTLSAGGYNLSLYAHKLIDTNGTTNCTVEKTGVSNSSTTGYLWVLTEAGGAPSPTPPFTSVTIS